MFRSLSTAVLLLLLALPGVALAQNTGKLSGRVTDAATGEPLIGANVFVADLQRGASTNVDGAYDILGLNVGQFAVRVSYAGYETQTIDGVEISSGRTRTLDVQLQPSNALGEGVTVIYERPLIQRDAIGVPKVLTGADIANLPVRGVQSVAAIQAGVVSNDGSNTLNIRGGRGEEVDYYIDGVKVIGSASVPQLAIAEQEMLIGTIPPQYGDATAGVINISTRTGGNDFFGAVEAITSQGLDSYGYNLGSLSLGGPLVRNRVSFFASAQGTFQADASPYAIGIPRLRDDVYARLQESPQVIRIRRSDLPADFSGFAQAPLFEDADFFYASFPSASFDPYASGFDAEGNRVGLPVDSLAVLLGVPVSSIVGGPENAVNFFSDASLFDTRSSKDDPGSQLLLTGNVDLRPISNVNLRLGGTLANNRDREFSFARSLFNRDLYRTNTDRTARGFATFRQIISNTAFYQVQAEFSDRFGETYPDEFGSGVENIIRYGDIEAEQNAVARRYYTRTGNNFTVLNDDGNFPTAASGRAARNTFFGPGTPLTNYSKFSQQQFRLSGNAQTQIGVHELSFGGEFESLTERSFSIGGGFARLLAQSEAVVNGDTVAITNYSDIPYNNQFSGIDFRNPGSVSYYGYNYLGTQEVDTEDLEGFLSQSSDSTGIAPRNPIYYGGFLRDRIEFDDLVIDLGLRVDVFDNNTQVLRDPYALVDIFRVSDFQANLGIEGVPVPAEFPSTIGSDFAVYTLDNQITGYRDAEGRFFNAAGEQVDTRANIAGNPTSKPGNSLTADSFTDYAPQVTIMPRIGVTFPVTDRALFFASFNVTSQRPSENAFATIQDYAFAGATSGRTVNNSNLRPEVTTQYELGFRQSIGEQAAFTLSGFYRTQRNKITLRNFNEAWPAGYTTYTNLDFTTTKGIETAFDLRRTRNLSANVNYTLSFAEGTGSDSQTASLLSFRTVSGIFPETLAPLSFDQRHNVNLSVDYRLGDNEGPMIGGIRPFAGFGLNVLGAFKSGNRYTQLDEGARTSDYNSDIGLTVDGTVNSVVIPSTLRLDLKVDRRFNLGGANLQGFLWVQNLLDSDNVIGVYRTTGLPNDDGFLDTDPDVIANLSQIQQDAFRYLYGQYVGGPVDPGGFKTSGNGFYSLPRRVRLGVTLDF